MTKHSPNVIFKVKYCLALKSRDNKNNSLNYKEDREKDVDEMIDYFSNEKKKLVNMFEYYMGHTRGENVNLVLENGNYATKNDLKKIKNNYKKYIKDSNLWKGILSFNKEYLDENIDIKKLEQKIAKEVMPQFLKYCGFQDIKKMSYVFSIHTNKKHPHIHLAFIEKKPNYLYKNGKVNYRRKGKITVDEQHYLKRLVELVIEREKYYAPLVTNTNEDIDYLKTFFNPKDKNYVLNNINEIYVEEKIMKLGELIKEYRSINNQLSNKVKYNSIKNNELGKEIKALTKDIKKYLFSDENSILYDCRKNIKSDLQKLNDYFDTLNRNNNVKEIIKENSIVSKKEEYIDNYIYNAIVNHSLYKYNHILNVVKNRNNNEKITLDDLIQELAYENSRDNNFNDKERRRNVLNHYFIGDDIISKFPSKYRIEKAISNINKEMDRASEEFSKLFDYDEKNK